MQSTSKTRLFTVVYHIWSVLICPTPVLKVCSLTESISPIAKVRSVRSCQVPAAPYGQHGCNSPKRRIGRVIWAPEQVARVVPGWPGWPNAFCQRICLGPTGGVNENTPAGDGLLLAAFGVVDYSNEKSEPVSCCHDGASLGPSMLWPKKPPKLGKAECLIRPNRVLAFFLLNV